MSELPQVGAKAVLQDVNNFLRDMAQIQGSFGQLQRIEEEAARAAAQGYGPQTQLTEAIDKTGRAAQDAIAPTQNLGKAYQDAADATSKLATPLLVVGGALTGVSTANAMAAARFETLGVALNRTALNAGLSADEVGELERTMNASGISMIGAREIIMRLIQSQVDMTQATRLTRAAQDLAVIGNVNSTETANDLAYAVSSLNGHILRKYGLFVTIDGALRTYGESLGLTGDELTTFAAHADDVTKRQAFLNQILDQAGAFTGVYEEAMGTAGKSMTSLPRLISDLSVELGTVLLPVLTAVVGGFSDLLKRFLDLPESVQAAIGTIMAVGGGILLLSGTVLKIVPQVFKFATAIGAAKTALITLSTATGGSGTVIGGLGALLAGPTVLAVLGVTAALVGLAALVIHVTNVKAALDKQAQALTATWNDQIGTMTDLQGVMGAGARMMTEHEQDIIRVDLADRNHGRTLRETLEAEKARLLAQEERLLATQADIAASDGLDAAMRESMTAQNDFELATVRAAIATKDEEIAFLQQMDTARQLAAATARLQGQADAYAQAAANAQHEQEQLNAAFEYGTTSAADLARAAALETNALANVQRGASHAQAVILEVARAEAQAGDAALTAADKALIYYDALMRVATAERTARINEASAIAESTIMLAELTAGYETAGAAGVSSADSVAERYRQLAYEQADAARVAALDIKYWHEDQNEWIMDNEAGLTADLQAEFLARTEAARAQADVVKEDNADLALEILSAEQEYQRKKAQIMTMADEGQRAAALAILERENGERLVRAQERANLEAQIEEEKLQREIANMRTAGAAGGTAMAQSFAEEWAKIKDVFNQTGSWAAAGVVLPEEIVAQYGAWLGRMREEVQKADWTDDQKNAVALMLDEIEADLNGTTLQIEKDAAAVALIWANAGLSIAAGWEEGFGAIGSGADDLLLRMQALTAEEWTIQMGFEIEGLPEGLLPTSPKSRWQARLEMLESWARSHPIDITMAAEMAATGGIGEMQSNNTAWSPTLAMPAPTVVVVERDTTNYSLNYSIPPNARPSRGSVINDLQALRLGVA